LQFNLVVIAGQKTCPAGDLCCSSGICGDPQFNGFLGQSYQVHGVAGQTYNVLSTPHFQYNALFSYLDQGKCRKGTMCFSHPGNYFGQVGLLVRDEQNDIARVKIISGPVDAGMTVFLNDKPLTVSASSISLGDSIITFSTPFEVVIHSPEFSMKLSNSDMFINQDISINNSLLSQIQRFKQASKSGNSTTAEELESVLPHGLLGQTWQYKTYSNRWKFIEGTLFEYATADGVLGVDFKYNRF